MAADSSGRSRFAPIALALLTGLFAIGVSVLQGRRSLAETSSPDGNVVVGCAGSSVFDAAMGNERTFPGGYACVDEEMIRRVTGLPEARGGASSLEVPVIVTLQRPAPALLPGWLRARGIDPAGFQLRNARLISGRMPVPGARELLVGARQLGRWEGLTPGGHVRLGEYDWSVVGVFEAAGSIFETEIWADRGAVMKAFGLTNPAALVRIEGPASRKSFAEAVDRLSEHKLAAVSEREELVASLNPEATQQIVGVLLVLALGMLWAHASLVRARFDQLRASPEGQRRLTPLLLSSMRSIAFCLAIGCLGTLAAHGQWISMGIYDYRLRLSWVAIGATTAMAAGVVLLVSAPYALVLRRRPGRLLRGAFWTASGVSLAATSAAFVVLMAVFLEAWGSMRSLTRPVIDFYRGGNMWSEFKTEPYLQRIRALPGVKSVGWFKRTFHKGKPRFMINEGNQGWLEALGAPLVDPAPAVRECWNRDPEALVAEVSLARDMGWQDGQAIDLVTELGPMRFRYCGIVSRHWGRRAVVHAEYMDARRPPEERGRARCIVALSTPADHASALLAARSQIEASDDPLFVDTPEDTQLGMFALNFIFPDFAHPLVRDLPDLSLRRSLGSLPIVLWILLPAYLLVIAVVAAGSALTAGRARAGSSKAGGPLWALPGTLLGGLGVWVAFHRQGIQAGWDEFANIRITITSFAIGTTPAVIVAGLAAWLTSRRVSRNARSAISNMGG